MVQLAFQNTADFDTNIRRVIPYYDEIYRQVLDLIRTVCGKRPIAALDTGCGTGNYAVQATGVLDFSRLVLCDPSGEMLELARKKTLPACCELRRIGSEQLDYDRQFDVVTAIQSHHYFDRETRRTAVQRCFRALKPGGLFICFENTAPFTETGKKIMLGRLELFGLQAGRTLEEVKSHSARYNTQFFPLNIREHLELLRETGFETAEVFWHSYMQTGFYGIRPAKEETAG